MHCDFYLARRVRQCERDATFAQTRLLHAMHSTVPQQLSTPESYTERKLCDDFLTGRMERLRCDAHTASGTRNAHSDAG